MTPRNVVLAFCLLVAGLVWAVEGRSAAKGIRWHQYEEAVALGQQENKKLFLHFYADWCAFCERMDKETFKHPEVIRYLNENFIASRIDTDKQKKVAQAYRVRGLPMTWFVSESGEEISSLPGFIPAETLLNIVRYVASDSYKHMSFKDFLKTL
jgi:thioredoxin-related protein